MKSANIEYNPRLDHIRLFAAALVFIFHSFHYFYLGFQADQLSPWLGIITEGHTGIGLFFTLSGFLFMQIAIKNPQIQYTGFIKNRFLRIFPLYIVIFLVAISINRNHFSGGDWSYLLFSNIGSAPTSSSFLTGAAWTIGVEFLFYLSFPFLARITLTEGPRYLLKWLVILLLFKLAAFDFLDDPIHTYYSTILGRFDQFLIGMLFALLMHQYRHKLHFKAGSVILATGLVFANSYLQARFGSFFSTDRESLFWISWSMQESLIWGVFIVVWSTASIRIPSWLDNIMQRGGEISFSFYLLHAFVLHIIFVYVGALHIFPSLILNAACITLVAYLLTWLLASLSYETIEKPFLAKRVKYSSPLS